MTQSGEKLEKRPQPDRYCPTCLGYGQTDRPYYDLQGTGQVVTLPCKNCCGTGWVKA